MVVGRLVVILVLELDLLGSWEPVFVEVNLGVVVVGSPLVVVAVEGIF